MNCRVQKRREWSVRMLHELSYHSRGSTFVTLTYRDEMLPFYPIDEYDLVKGTIQYPTLSKKHLRDFFKRLRKALGEDKIKYFACGEYGSLTQRPHYHSIIFNMNNKKADRDLIKMCWPYADWSVGSISSRSFGMAEKDSIQYVAQYIDKKLTGDEAVKEFDCLNREPVFNVCSKGLGERFAYDNEIQLKQMLSITVNGVRMSIPRYYIKKLGINPDELKLKAQESDCELTERITGEYMSGDDYYKLSNKDDYLKYHEVVKHMRRQHDSNLKAKLALKQSSL